jgi:phosphohistidine swiveling domain-containing protein
MFAQQQLYKWIYLFSEGNAKMRDLLGGKGAGVAEMTKAGLPVPPGFTITTEACNAYYDADKQFPQGMWEQVMAALKIVEVQTGKGFGLRANPLLVSVRSGAKFSMPGLMDTVLNLGINDETVLGLVRLTGDERFAYDAYRRFIQMFGKIVLDIDPWAFEQLLDRYIEQAGVKTDAEIPAEALKKMVGEFKQIAERQSGEPFPTDVYQQLHKAIEAVFSSWNNRRAIEFRNFNKIPHNLGTAVNVQSMVFGNMGNDSGTGVAFTRNPITGEKQPFGEYLLNAQGEDVVAGIRTPSKISHLQEELPSVYQQFLEIAQRLEQYYRDVQDLEFTIEHGRLYLLQTRTLQARGSAEVSLRFAIDLLDEGLISEREALLRVEPEDLHRLLALQLPRRMKIKPLAYGLNASPGVALGEAIFDSARVVEYARLGKKVILIRPEVSPDDVDGILLAQGVITSRGGATSHAAIVCRGLGKPCVAGCEGIRVDEEERLLRIRGTDIVLGEGHPLTLDGSSGAIYEGMIPLIEVNIQDEPYLLRFITLLEAANTDDYVEDGAGILWMLKDTIRNRAMPNMIAGLLPATLDLPEAVAGYISFIQPPPNIVSDILQTMHWQNDPDTDAVVWGIMHHLGHMLQHETGIGNHYLAIRPLVDPQCAWIDLRARSITSEESVIRESPVQLVGLEFFGINHFLRTCLPWGEVQWWVLVSRECTSFARRKPPKRPLRWRRRARLLLASTRTLPRCANPELVSAPHLCYISLRLQSARKQPTGSQTKDRLLFASSAKNKRWISPTGVSTTGRRLIQEQDHTSSLWCQYIES